MATCLGKSCSFGLPRVPFVNCCQLMYLVVSLLVLRAGCGIWLYQFLIIAYPFTHISNICPKANWTLGLRRNLYACPQEEKEAAYKGLMGPDLVYSGSVWDPSCVGLQDELEKVQNRAARFATGNYNYDTGNMTGILEHLNWESLKKRRRDSRVWLILLYKNLKGKASIPTDDLIPPVRRCRNHHSSAFQVSIANTDIYKCSFFPRPLGIGMHFQTLIVSSAEGAKDGIAKFTSLVRAPVLVVVYDCHFYVWPVTILILILFQWPGLRTI